MFTTECELIVWFGERLRVVEKVDWRFGNVVRYYAVCVAEGDNGVDEMSVVFVARCGMNGESGDGHISRRLRGW